jgi:hypothetical protein
MVRWVGRIATIVALCCAIGLHWMALQSVAWTTMLVQNAKRASFCQAITQTFDGAHPCSLCHVVSKGKTSERKSDLRPLTSKIDMMNAPRAASVAPPLFPLEYPEIFFALAERFGSPIVPPPRVVAS